MEPLPLGIVSDEVAPDFREALGHALAWGITRFELRVLKSGRVPLVDPAEVEEIQRLTAELGLTITALSPGIFKHRLSRRDDIERELGEILPRSFVMARQLGAKLLIAFGFQREPGEPASVYDAAAGYLRRAAQMAEGEGLRIAVENEPGFWCDTGVNTRRLIRDVGSPALGANWDPCNAYGTPETPYPDGYEAIRDVVFNAHAKDTRRGALIQCVPIGEGAIDWRGQVAALLRDRPVPHITIETHCLPLVENSRKNVDVLRRLMREAG